MKQPPSKVLWTKYSHCQRYLNALNAYVNTKLNFIRPLKISATTHANRLLLDTVCRWLEIIRLRKNSLKSPKSCPRHRPKDAKMYSSCNEYLNSGYIIHKTYQYLWGVKFSRRWIWKLVSSGMRFYVLWRILTRINPERCREQVPPTGELNLYQNTRRHIAQDSDHSAISLFLLPWITSFGWSRYTNKSEDMTPLYRSR